MKTILIICATLMFGCVSAQSASQPKYEQNWFEQIFQSLTGTGGSSTSQIVAPVTPRHHHTIKKKHRHSHHAHVTTPHASAGGTISPAHTKLFEEFQVWQKKHQWEDIINGGRIE